MSTWAVDQSKPPQIILSVVPPSFRFLTMSCDTPAPQVSGGIVSWSWLQPTCSRQMRWCKGCSHWPSLHSAVFSDAATQPRRARFAGMEWAEGNQWSLSVELAPGVYDFKLVTAVAESGEAVEWEAGDNRQLKVCRCGGYIPVPSGCPCLCADAWLLLSCHCMLQQLLLQPGMGCSKRPQGVAMIGASAWRKCAGQVLDAAQLCALVTVWAYRQQPLRVS